jgi:hypothetical protein
MNTNRPIDCEQQMAAPVIAKIVRENDQKMRNWLKLRVAEG